MSTYSVPLATPVELMFKLSKTGLAILIFD